MVAPIVSGHAGLPVKLRGALCGNGSDDRSMVRPDTKLLSLRAFSQSLYSSSSGRAAMTKTRRIALCNLALMAMLSGCYVPEAYQIVNTIHPQYEDEDVRFRTTYYLRVFDLCSVDEPHKFDRYHEGAAGFVHREKNEYRIIKDSLYRFRMTGQSQAYHNNVRFESGTLTDYQVDPFGTTIEFDEKLKRFQPSGCMKNGKSREARDCTSPLSKETTPPDTRTNPCPQGEAKDTKFYLLGPEGIKELKLSERLVMAMSTDAKPLISALQRIAGIKAHAEAEAAAQYGVKRNRARVAVALEELNAVKGKINEKTPADTASSPEALETILLNLFEAKGGTQ